MLKRLSQWNLDISSLFLFFPSFFLLTQGLTLTPWAICTASTVSPFMQQIEEFGNTFWCVEEFLFGRWLDNMYIYTELGITASRRKAYFFNSYSGIFCTITSKPKWKQASRFWLDVNCELVQCGTRKEILISTAWSSTGKVIPYWRHQRTAHNQVHVYSKPFGRYTISFSSDDAYIQWDW